MKTVSIHQPVYLPWLGFLKKIMSCDVFVFLDDVQYEKNGWQNRNKIRTKEGELWLTVPVKTKSKMLLKDVTIDNSSNWSKKHLKSISLNYSRARFFEKYRDNFKRIYEKEFHYLIDLNLEIINLLMEKFKIKTRTMLSSEFKISEQGSERILKICKALDADSYLSGSAGKDYLKLEEFTANDIKVNFQNFQHPVYNQVFVPFYPNMAAIDLLYNEGEKSEKILKKAGNF